MTGQQHVPLSDHRQRRKVITLSALLAYQAVFALSLVLLPSKPPLTIELGKFIAAGMLTLLLPTYFLLPIVCVAVSLRLHTTRSMTSILIGIQAFISLGMTIALLPPVSG